VAVVTEARGVVAEAVVAARLVAAVPEAAAVAPAAVAAAVPEAVAEAVVAAVVVALAVAPVVRTTLPHLCIEAPRPTSPGVVLTSHVSFSRSTNPTQQIFLGAIRICAFKVRRSLRHYAAKFFQRVVRKP
jgi:hypothetical protein